MGRVVSVNRSTKKGVSKKPVYIINLLKGKGVEHDAHAGSDRQVSVMPVEQAIVIDGFKPGIFAENITTEKFDFSILKIGDTIKVGNAILRLIEKGKVCPRKCSIYYKLGNCIMPKKGLFFEVVKEGVVKQGDEVITVSS